MPRWPRETLTPQERLAHLKRQCQPHLIEAVRSSVENICKKVMTQSVECAAKLKDIAVAMYEEQNVKLTKGLRCRYPPLVSRPPHYSLLTTMNIRFVVATLGTLLTLRITIHPWIHEPTNPTRNPENPYIYLLEII